MLKGTLKRMENLVQDLQDELEMKEGLTVKELPNETSGKHYDDNNKIHVDPEPMSKIEAELEAELARLELNITSKCLEEEISDFNEVDQEFIGDIVCGELKVDMVPRDLTSRVCGVSFKVIENGQNQCFSRCPQGNFQR